MSKLLDTYLDKRMLFVFLNGVASGFPWIIIGSAMTLWLKDAGLTRTAIGFFWFNLFCLFHKLDVGTFIR
jgi:PAT family beta-lactamase induction signal transducer AmpG